MPTYEYRCKACNREFEYQQKMSDPDLVHCEACGEDKLERLISWTTVRSDTWKAALQSKNPKEAMKGIWAVDRSRGQRFTDAATDAATPSTDVPGDGDDAVAGAGEEATSEAEASAPEATTEAKAGDE